MRIASLGDGLQFGIKQVGSFGRFDRPEVIQIVFIYGLSSV